MVTVQVQVGRGSVLLVAGTNNRKYQVQVDPKPRAALYRVCRPSLTQMEVTIPMSLPCAQLVVSSAVGPASGGRRRVVGSESAALTVTLWLPLVQALGLRNN